MNIENEVELVTYEFSSKKGTVKISFEDSTENPKFKIQGPKELIHKAIGGIGFENQDDTETTATEVNLNTEPKRLYAILEVIKLLKD